MPEREPLVRHLARVRRALANRIWAVASWVYPYVDRTPDDVTTAYWDMSATFVGTEAEADGWFDRLTSLTCADDRPLHDCRFVVGGMTRIHDEESNR